MEIYSKNGDVRANTGVSLEQQNSRSRTREKPSRPPPITDLPSSTLPSNKRLANWKSSPVTHADFSEFTFPLTRKLHEASEKLNSKAFLRPTEHILATFYALVFIIEGAEWHILKSEYLPIYFVRVSVKNVKYPFRILVIDNESENHIRVVDFVVNCNTKTSIREEAVCWTDQETFGAKFSNKNQAFQFYDTISRMASTLRKGKKLENENLDKMVDLEIHLPNSEVRTYQCLKSDKVKEVLKIVCNKEKLAVNDHYFHHMQRTDDSLNMDLRVAEIRTDKIRLISKTESRGSSIDALEQVSIPVSRKKNVGMFSLFRRRFSRKRKESRHYSSAPSIIQYTDNVFMVERQSGDQVNDEINVRGTTKSGNVQSTHSPARPTKSDTTVNRSTTSTLSKTVKRQAPSPPKLIMPNAVQQTSDNNGLIVNGNHTIEKTKKRRAPSPPKIVNSPETPGRSSDGTFSKGPKPPMPPKPAFMTSSSPTSVTQPETESLDKETSNSIEKKKRLPVFIAPPPPDSTPPPIDECETPPLGPIYSEMDDGSVEIPVEINGMIDDTRSLDSKSSAENHENASKPAEEGPKEDEVNVDNEKSDVVTNGDNENKDDDDEKENKLKTKDEDKINVDKTKEAEVRDTVNDDPSLQKSEELVRAPNQGNEHKLVNVDENKNVLNEDIIKNLTPDQLQALLVKTQTPGMGQQNPVNLHNQQIFAMQQNQQMLSNILMQQMIQQQMQSQQRPPTMLPVAMGGVLPLSPMSPLNTMQPAGGVSTIQPPGMMSPVGTIPAMQHHPNAINYPTSMWPQAQPPAQPVVQPLTQSVPSPSLEAKQTDEVKSSTSIHNSSQSEGESKPSSQTETKTSKSLPTVKEEDLVNRPLFKKMLAQISQGKLQGVPKVANQTQANPANPPTSPVSPAAKITKVPTSYVASAEKNVPQAKHEDEKTAPISLGEIGRKSSYVDSAIGSQKTDDVDHKGVKIVTSANTAMDSTPTKEIKPHETNVKIENTNQYVGIKSDAGKIALNQNVHSTAVSSVRSPIKHESPYISSNVQLIQNGPSAAKVANNNTSSGINQNTHTPHPTDKFKPTSPTSAPSVNVAGRISVTNTSKPIKSTPTSSVTVIDHSPTVQTNSPANKPKTDTPTHPPNMNFVARNSGQIIVEKRGTQVSNQSNPSQVGHTSHKLIIEEPDLGAYKVPRTIVPPLTSRLKEDNSTNAVNLTGVNQNGKQSYGYATTGRLVNTDVQKPPEVAKKPRHMSEPKPIIASKPTYDIRQSKTLPTKNKKQQHIQISLSLTAEERMELHKPPGLTTAANAGGR